jgi:type IV pilus assembly protein PilO
MAIDIDTVLKLSSTKKLAVLSVVLVAIFYGYYSLFYVAKQDELERVETQLVGLQKKLKESKDAARRLPEFRKEVEELNKSFDMALAQLPDKKEIPTLLENITTTGRGANLEFLLFKPKPEIPKGFYAEVPVEVKVEGEYDNLVDFFQRVGEMSRIVNISSLKISNAKDIEGRIKLTANFVVTTFMFLEKEAGKGAKK